MLRKTVIITGASGGIGNATAKVFAANGYNLALTYNHGSTKELEDELKKYNVDVKSFKLDQEKESSISKCIKDITSSFDYIDTIVCNAGIAERGDLLTEKSTSEIDHILDVNLRGTILLNREVAKIFIKQKHGNIINISSVHGLEGASCEVTYSATKAGVIGLTKALASELAPYNIRVNAIAPAFIETNMTSCYTSKEKKEIIKRTPLGRLGKPEDVADAIYFLASDKASFITGICLPITGGVVKF